MADDGCLIADDMGLCFIRTLAASDKVTLLHLPGKEDMPPADRHNFLKTPLILETRDGQGQSVYLAVVIAYVAEERDAKVAIRTADHLARLTGNPARPVIAARFISDWLSEMVEAGQVFWHELDHPFLERIERRPETVEDWERNTVATARMIALKGQAETS
jgi:hypothetical protein